MKAFYSPTGIEAEKLKDISNIAIIRNLKTNIKKFLQKSKQEPVVLQKNCSYTFNDDKSANEFIKLLTDNGIDFKVRFEHRKPEAI